MKNEDYIPFGPEWEKEMKKMTVKELEANFTFIKFKDENKTQFIQRIGRRLNK